MLIVGLLGGLVFFLYGMEKMSNGMRRSAGNKMRSILATLTKNNLIALLIGAFVTMVIQSSSATTVMLVSFVQAELMTFTQSLGVILGANIGTTITAQMVAFELTDYAVIMIIVGFVLRMFGKSDNTKSIGDILLGFGILFYGMKMMSDTMRPLRNYPEFIEVMKSLESPFMGVLAGAAFTALVQSSSATTGVVIVLAQQGLITLDAGIPVILGANVGTCVTAGLASIGTAREAKRVALAHVLFNVGGVLIFIFWIPQFADLTRTIASSFDSQTARQVANAHTIFNIAVGLIFLPFIGFFARFILRVLPEEPREKGLDPVTWHLDDSIIATPAIALQLASAEIARMAKILGRMHNAAIIPFISDKPQRDQIYPVQLNLLQGVEMREKKINFLEERIRTYLLDISRQELAKGQGTEVNALIALLDSMERIGDVIIKQILPLVKKKERLGVEFSEEGRKELVLYHGKVGKQLDRLKQVMTKMDVSLAKKVKKKKSRYAHFDSRLRKHHLERMLAMKEASVETHSIHMELMDALNHINMYCADIAKKILKSNLGAGDEEEHNKKNNDVVTEQPPESATRSKNDLLS
ncbi:MAG: Na/Pi cotransporter family protein [Thermodesulfobacteriota bacterium]